MMTFKSNVAQRLIEVSTDFQAPDCQPKSTSTP